MVSASRFLPAPASAASIARSRSLRPQYALVACASLADTAHTFSKSVRSYTGRPWRWRRRQSSPRSPAHRVTPSRFGRLWRELTLGRDAPETHGRADFGEVAGHDAAAEDRFRPWEMGDAR